MASIDSC